MTYADTIAEVKEPMLTFPLVQIFIKDAENLLQQEFFKEFNRVEDNFKLMTNGFCTEKYLVGRYPWVTAEDKNIGDNNKKTNMTFSKI